MIEFFMPMERPPSATQQEHKVACRNGRPVFYEPERVRDARAKLTAFLARHAPGEPLEGPLRLVTKWIWPLPGRKAAQLAAMGTLDYAEYKTTRPDTDNVIKMLKDCMTRCGYWEDDAQVASEITEKFRGMHTGIYVRVEEIGP